MTVKSFQTSAVFLLFVLSAVSAFSQGLACKSQALSALKPIPKLKYQCNEDLTDSDDEVLTQPNRLKAINLYVQTLEKLTSADWWKTSVEDLNLCYFRGKKGTLTKDEKYGYKNGDYFFTLRGNNQYRIVVALDPCYQTGFAGSNLFLLNRVGNKVYAAEIVDGFFTRADFPIGFNYALNGNETIIEISTTSGGLNPSETYYYFTINKKTNRAVPKNLFKQDGKLTNKIYSDMLLSEPEEYGLPRGSVSLRVIKNHRLAKSFYVFGNTLETEGGENPKFIRRLLKWNGKFYE